MSTLFVSWLSEFLWNGVNSPTPSSPESDTCAPFPGVIYPGRADPGPAWDVADAREACPCRPADHADH
ncbi:hypothetical protein GCM10009832_06920 [Dietzia kunjamensis subsp. schimae]